MKVKELIEILSKFDEEKRILIDDYEWIYDIGNIDLEPHFIDGEDVYIIHEALTKL